jgi:hypothetical protein
MRTLRRIPLDRQVQSKISKVLFPILIPSFLALAGLAMIDRIDIESRLSGIERAVDYHQQWMEDVKERLERIEGKVDRLSAD